MDAGLNQSLANNAELALFGGVDNNSVTSPNRITLAGENLLLQFNSYHLTVMLIFQTSSSNRRRDDLRGVVRL